MYKLIYTKIAQKDALKLKKSNLKLKAQKTLDIIASEAIKTHPPYEELVGDLNGCNIPLRSHY